MKRGSWETERERDRDRGPACSRECAEPIEEEEEEEDRVPDAPRLDALAYTPLTLNTGPANSITCSFYGVHLLIESCVQP